MLVKTIKGSFACFIALAMAFGNPWDPGSFTLPIPEARAAGTCPKEPDQGKMKDINCSGVPESEKQQCEQCNQTISQQKQQLEKVKGIKASCEKVDAGCSKSVGASPGGVSNIRTGHGETSGMNSGASSCLNQKAGLNTQAKAAGDKCSKALKSCSKYAEAKDMKKMCEDLSKDAAKKAADNKKSAEETDKNAKKAGDNEKKGESAGGMPQMPQIPQQGGGDNPSQTPTDYPTANSEGASSSTAAQIESSQFNEDKNGVSSPLVGFGNTAPTDTATVTAAPGGFNSDNFDSASRDLASSGLGEHNGEGVGVAATASPPSGSGSGGLNSSGASLPGGGKAADGKSPDPNNPFEVPVGAGGRLGGPKGKSGGESDTALDAAATASFKEDFAANGEGSGSGDDDQAGSEEDIGYTVFKMVRYRYKELKKKGSI